MNSKCPVPLPNPKNPAYRSACGGNRTLQGEGADAVLFCERCKSKWTLDGKS